MNEMIERVARAICRAKMCGPRQHLDEQENIHWRAYELEAKAAIEAMREPTEAMCRVVEHTSDIFDAAIPWEMMIDAALTTDAAESPAHSQSPAEPAAS